MLGQTVAGSPDGKEVLTGSRDLSGQLWATQTGQESQRVGRCAGLPLSPESRAVQDFHRTIIGTAANGQEVLRAEWSASRTAHSAIH